ncbi:MAG: hypothetical protein LBG93_04270 [Treponema sp.]|jgi:hypothetical protein|nr:hypothetical protein [Treponema sp.]
MTEIERKTGMTDSECEYWDDYHTKNVFEPGPNLLKQGGKPGLAHNTLSLNELDKDVAEYLSLQAKAFNKSQTAVINDIIRAKLQECI